jgi:SAM-dependent methyltransferase
MMTVNQEKLEAVLERAVGDLSAGYGGVMVSIGDKLGLYRAMHGAGPLAPGELARSAGCDERYVREWLNSQAAGGYVDYHPVSGTYELTPEQGAVLADRESPTFVPPAWNVPASMFLDEERTIDAFRTGRGVGWGEHHPRLHHGVADFYRNAYRAVVASEWLPALDGVVDRLTAGDRVADVGCGHGHSTVAMAEAFPESTFLGIDLHGESVAAAREAARAAGVADRVTFEVADARTFVGEGFGLVCFFDALHDMGDPEGALRHAAGRLAPGGTVMIVEPFAHDRVEDNLTPVGRLYYAVSATVCTAHARAEGGDHGLGAQAGPARFAELCRRSGLTRFRQATATPFNMVLEARA